VSRRRSLKEMQDAGSALRSRLSSNTELPRPAIIEGIRDNFTGSLEKSCS
jgi:hypothetical protein